MKINNITITESGIILMMLLLSGVGYKLARQCIGSNCTKFSSICCSFEREALDNADALDLINNNNNHENTTQITEMVVEQIKHDLEEG